MQLEESNNTLRKDVENLSKEKTDLSQELRTQEEGNVFAFSPIDMQRRPRANSHFVLSEYEAQKEEISNSIRAQYEKSLANERTLKTQVNVLLFTGASCRRHALLSSSTSPYSFRPSTSWLRS